MSISLLCTGIADRCVKQRCSSTVLACRPGYQFALRPSRLQDKLERNTCPRLNHPMNMCFLSMRVGFRTFHPFDSDNFFDSISFLGTGPWSQGICPPSPLSRGKPHVLHSGIADSIMTISTPVARRVPSNCSLSSRVFTLRRTDSSTKK